MDQEYQKYLQLILKKKRLFVAVALVLMTAGIAVSYLLPKKFEATSVVFIEKSIISELVKGLAVTSTVEDKMKALTYAISSRTLIAKTIDDLDLNIKAGGAARTEQMINAFQKQLVVKQKDKEGLFIISFQHENPVVARDFVNTLVRRYIEENVSSKREESYGATKFISEQIGSFKEKYEKADAEVKKIRSDKGTILSRDQGMLAKEIADAQQKLDDLRIKRVQIEGQRAVLKSGDDRSKLVALQKRLDELRRQYTENYPDVVRVKGEIDELQGAMKGRAGFSDPQELERLDIELRSIRQAEDGQRRVIATDRQLLMEVPAARAQLEKSEQELNNQKILYDQLVARQGQSEVSKQMEVQDKTTTYRVVDPAVLPAKPVSPNRVMIIAFGIIGGVAASFGLLLLLDHFDRSFKASDEIDMLQLPVLAVIPQILKPDEIALETRRDRRLYRFAGAYFTLVLATLAFEALRMIDLDLRVVLTQALRNVL